MYKVGDIFKLDNEYPKRAKFCNENNYAIEECGVNENNEKLYKIVDYKTSEEWIKNNRVNEIQIELNALNYDIVQDVAGEIVPNIEERKARFIELHNELRTLLGKEERGIKQ